MPKIAADSVHEHVAHQEAAVIEAAIKLFNQRGVRDVSLADIAGEVGLARNSLYRYFPDKAHILAAWFRMTITPLVALSNAIADSAEPTAERLTQWVDAQFGYLTAPEHAVMLIASNEMATLPDDVRAELGSGHRELYASLSRILGQTSVGGTDCKIESTTMFIAAVVRSAAEQMRAGANADDVKTELRRAVLAIAGY